MGQKTEPGSATVPVSPPFGERGGDPAREVAPPSEPGGSAAEPRAAGKQESVIPTRDSGGQNPLNPQASYITRVVKQGETLSDLIREVYGISLKAALKPSLDDLVRQHNPAIVDPNLIQAGSVIRFPELPEGTYQGD